MLFDDAFANICPECKDTVFNLYDFGMEDDYQICLKCAQKSLTMVPGSMQCPVCEEFSVIEKSENLLVEKNNKRVKIVTEFLYCPKCESEGVTSKQLYMKKYHLAMALKYYKKPKKM